MLLRRPTKTTLGITNVFFKKIYICVCTGMLQIYIYLYICNCICVECKRFHTEYMRSICENLESSPRILQNVLVLRSSSSSARSPFFPKSSTTSSSPPEHTEMFAVPVSACSTLRIHFIFGQAKCYWILKHALLTDIFCTFALIGYLFSLL